MTKTYSLQDFRLLKKISLRNPVGQQTHILCKRRSKMLQQWIPPTQMLWLLLSFGYQRWEEEVGAGGQEPVYAPVNTGRSPHCDHSSAGESNPVEPRIRDMYPMKINTSALTLHLRA